MLGAFLLLLEVPTQTLGKSSDQPHFFHSSVEDVSELGNGVGLSNDVGACKTLSPGLS